MKILIVDDSLAMRRIVQRTLRQAGFDGHDFIEATNGKEGLAKVEAEAPDVVLSDWNMPEMNGYEFLCALRATGAKVPFGFITTEGTPEMRQKAAEAGANFLLEKPFTAEQMAQTINTYVK